MSKTVVVSVDGDGHFHITPLSNRESVIINLKKICDGDYWDNEVDDEEFENLDYNNCSYEDWNNFISSLTQRGMMEIKTLVF